MKTLRYTHELAETLTHAEQKKVLLDHISNVLDNIQIEEGDSILDLDYVLTVKQNEDYFGAVYDVRFGRGEIVSWRDVGEPVEEEEVARPTFDAILDELERQPIAQPIPNLRFEPQTVEALRATAPAHTFTLDDAIAVQEQRRQAEGVTAEAPHMPVPRPRRTRPDGYTEEEYQFIRREYERLEREAEAVNLGDVGEFINAFAHDAQNPPETDRTNEAQEEQRFAEPNIPDES